MVLVACNGSVQFFESVLSLKVFYNRVLVTLPLLIILSLQSQENIYDALGWKKEIQE